MDACHDSRTFCYHNTHIKPAQQPTYWLNPWYTKGEPVWCTSSDTLMCWCVLYRTQ
jgi:hypothetical protein